MELKLWFAWMTLVINVSSYRLCVCVCAKANGMQFLFSALLGFKVVFGIEFQRWKCISWHKKTKQNEKKRKPSIQCYKSTSKHLRQMLQFQKNVSFTLFIQCIYFTFQWNFPSSTARFNILMSLLFVRYMHNEPLTHI